jgi:hypothetical protein
MHSHELNQNHLHIHQRNTPYRHRPSMARVLLLGEQVMFAVVAWLRQRKDHHPLRLQMDLSQIQIGLRREVSQQEQRGALVESCSLNELRWR